jgi:hypothetical protein
MRNVTVIMSKYLGALVDCKLSFLILELLLLPPFQRPPQTRTFALPKSTKTLERRKL